MGLKGPCSAQRGERGLLGTCLQRDHRPAGSTLRFNVTFAVESGCPWPGLVLILSSSYGFMLCPRRAWFDGGVPWGGGPALLASCEGFPPSPSVHVTAWGSLGGEDGSYLA